MGASLALALHTYAGARNWQVAMIEPFAPSDAYQPSYDARSTALSYGSRLIYQRLGVWQSIAERAEAIEHIHVSDRGRLGATRLNARDESVPALGYVVENAWIGHCLWQALDQHPVQRYCPAQVQRLEQVAGGYRLGFADGRELEASLVVLADGGRSNLREQLGIAVQHQPYGQSAIVANISPELAHGGQAFERFTDEGPMALLPLSDNRCALVWTRDSADAQALMALDDQGFLAQLQQAFGYRLGALKRVGQRYVYPLALTEAREQVRSHLVVLGNAAHSLHPIAGQGYNLSLRDVQALAEVLGASAQAPGSLAVLQQYVERQRLDQQMTVSFSDQVTRLFSNNQPVLAAGRNVGLFGLDLLPPAKRWFARQAMGLGVRSL